MNPTAVHSILERVQAEDDEGVEDHSLEEEEEEGAAHSLKDVCDFGKAEPSPFSSRRVMYENEEVSYGYGAHQITPAFRMVQVCIQAWGNVWWVGFCKTRAVVCIPNPPERASGDDVLSVFNASIADGHSGWRQWDDRIPGEDDEQLKIHCWVVSPQCAVILPQQSILWNAAQQVQTPKEFYIH